MDDECSDCENTVTVYTLWHTCILSHHHSSLHLSNSGVNQALHHTTPHIHPHFIRFLLLPLPPPSSLFNALEILQTDLKKGGGIDEESRVIILVNGETEINSPLSLTSGMNLEGGRWTREEEEGSVE